MRIEIIDNKNLKMGDTLIKAVESSNQIRIAVAFAKYSGFKVIKSSLKGQLDKGGSAIFLVGLDFQTTDPAVLRELFLYSQSYPKLIILCMSGNTNRIAGYHPKLYLFNQGNNTSTAIIGSSNLTRGGLENNVEINVLISSESSDDFFNELVILFQQLQYSTHRVIPNIQYIDNYEELFKETKKGKKISKHPKYLEMQELEKQLPTARIDNSELVGWMKLVYQYLPNEEFNTHEIYQFESIFKQEYPENQNIKAKIRQQLQFLEKVGLIRKIERGLWVKLDKK